MTPIEPLEKTRATIIIPARNEGPFLAHTLESAYRTAGYANYRVVVIDDGSKDGCARGLLERFPEMDLEIITVGENDRHGTGVSRNRGLKVQEADLREGDVVVTTDAHMVMPQNWLRNMIAVHAEYPDAFLMAASCGFRSVADLHCETIIDPGDEKVAATLSALGKKYPGKPVFVEKGREEADEKDPERLQRLMHKFGLCMVHADGPTQKKPVWIFHVKDSIMAPGKPVGVHYGCRLEYDDGFITPKWWRTWDTEHPPMRPVVPVDAFMGACYLFPAKFFLERLGGWPWVAGWVHEEPWLSIAAGIQGIPLLLVRDVVTAHSYDRPVTLRPNVHGIMLNREAVTEVCFDDMKGPIQRELFGAPLDTEMLERRVGRELRRRREMVQGGRVMTDREYLHRMGLLQHFDPDAKKIAIEQLGVCGADLKDASARAIEGVLDGLHANRRLKWGYGCFRLGEGGEVRTSIFREDRIFDPDTGKRKDGETELMRKEEMQGAILRDVIGLAAMDWIFANTIAGKLPILFQDTELLKESVRAVQAFITETIAGSLNFAISTLEQHEILLRVVRAVLRGQSGGPTDEQIEALVEEERAKLKAEVETKAKEGTPADGGDGPTEGAEVPVQVPPV